MSISQIIDAVDEWLTNKKPIHQIMREYEAVSGYRVVIPGMESWLSSDDWDDTVVVSVDDANKMVRLVAILAKRPGAGALRRTVAAITAAGLTPCVLEPTRPMHETLTRWGWQRKVFGSGFDAEVRWTPTILSRHA